MIPAKTELVGTEVSYHLLCLKREVDGGSLMEVNVFHADETHFLIDTNSRRTFSMKEDCSV